MGLNGYMASGNAPFVPDRYCEKLAVLFWQGNKTASSSEGFLNAYTFSDLRLSGVGLVLARYWDLALPGCWAAKCSKYSLVSGDRTASTLSPPSTWMNSVSLGTSLIFPGQKLRLDFWIFVVNGLTVNFILNCHPASSTFGRLIRWESQLRKCFAVQTQAFQFCLDLWDRQLSIPTRIQYNWEWES